MYFKAGDYVQQEREGGRRVWLPHPRPRPAPPPLRRRAARRPSAAAPRSPPSARPTRPQSLRGKWLPARRRSNDRQRRRWRGRSKGLREPVRGRLAGEELLASRRLDSAERPPESSRECRGLAGGAQRQRRQMKATQVHQGVVSRQMKHLELEKGHCSHIVSSLRLLRVAFARTSSATSGSFSKAVRATSAIAAPSRSARSRGVLPRSSTATGSSGAAEASASTAAAWLLSAAQWRAVWPLPRPQTSRLRGRTESEVEQWGRDADALL